MNDCDVRGHRYSVTNRELCVRCGRIDQFDARLELECWRCGQIHIGSIMRINGNLKTAQFIEIECPKQGSRLAFCHCCQRALWHSGAVEILLMNDAKLHLPGKFWNWVPTNAFKEQANGFES